MSAGPGAAPARTPDPAGPSDGEQGSARQPQHGHTRPHVLLSVAVSVDGYIDDASPQRLLLSNAADFDRVDQVRAESDAVLIGAETLRRDNPRLLVNSAERRAARAAAGRPEYPRWETSMPGCGSGTTAAPSSSTPPTRAGPGSATG